VAVPVAGAKAPKPVTNEQAAKKSRRREVKEPPQAVPVGDADAGLDVELLPQAVPVATAGAVKYLGQISRRDFVAFGAGAGSVLVAIFLGWIVAKIAGH
jgi:hypothetical protein